MEEKIMQWIEEYQSGKSGIYPYQVALQVCAEFRVGIDEALSYVQKHIREVLAGSNMRVQADAVPASELAG